MRRPRIGARSTVIATCKRPTRPSICSRATCGRHQRDRCAPNTTCSDATRFSRLSTRPPHSQQHELTEEYLPAELRQTKPASVVMAEQVAALRKWSRRPGRTVRLTPIDADRRCLRSRTPALLQQKCTRDGANQRDVPPRCHHRVRPNRRRNLPAQGATCGVVLAWRFRARGSGRAARQFPGHRLIRCRACHWQSARHLLRAREALLSAV